MKRISVLLVPCLSAFGLMQAEGCDPEIDADQQGGLALSPCSSEQLEHGNVIASETFVREKGKPVDHVMEFSLDTGGACVLVSSGPNGAPAPASMTLVLDDVTNVIEPSALSAHSQLISRSISPELAGIGEHSLTIQLRGRGGHTPAVASVSVVDLHPALQEQTGGSVASEISSSRLEDKSAEATVLKDELIVTTEEDLSTTQVNGLLGGSFGGVVVGRIESSPIFQVYIPGLSGGDDLRELAQKVVALSEVAHVSLHHIGGVADYATVPSNGHDIDYWSEGDATAAAWHLAQVHAPDAWSGGMVSSSAIVGVLELGGFNVEHPELAQSIVEYWVGNQNTQDSALMETAHPPKDPFVCEILDEKACESWKSCYLPAETERGFHGTAIAGLVGAEGDNTSTEPFANITGILWNAKMHANRAVPVRVDGYPTYSSFGAQLAVSAMAHNQVVSIVNMSFGDTAFCGDKTPNPDFSTSDLSLLEKRLELRQQRLSDEAADWATVLRNNPDLLIVQGSGNWSQGLCEKNGLPGALCTAESAGHVCAVADAEAQGRILCMGGTNESKKLYQETSLRGEGEGVPLLFAPAENVGVLSFDSGMTLVSGTSISAPIASGGAALVWGVNQKMNASVVRDMMQTGGSLMVDLPDESKGRVLDLALSVDNAYRCRELYTSKGVNVPEGDVFTDVEAGAWYYRPIDILVRNCILNGHPDNSFKPHDPINRAEALKVVFRIAFPKVDFSSAPPKDPFSDVPKEEWYAPYAKFLVDSGIDFLSVEGKLDPSADISRGEFARLLVLAAVKAKSEARGMRRVALADFKAATPESVYLDVPVIDANRHIYTLTNQCIVSGYEGGELFGPNDTLTRAQAAKVGCLTIYGFGARQCGESEMELASCSPVVGL